MKGKIGIWDRLNTAARCNVSDFVSVTQLDPTVYIGISSSKYRTRRQTDNRNKEVRRGKKKEEGKMKSEEGK
jgi:hypothetical protein